MVRVSVVVPSGFVSRWIVNVTAWMCLHCSCRSSKSGHVQVAVSPANWTVYFRPPTVCDGTIHVFPSCASFIVFGDHQSALFSSVLHFGPVAFFGPEGQNGSGRSIPSSGFGLRLNPAGSFRYQRGVLLGEGPGRICAVVSMLVRQGDLLLVHRPPKSFLLFSKTTEAFSGPPNTKRIPIRLTYPLVGSFPFHLIGPSSSIGGEAFKHGVDRGQGVCALKRIIHG